MRPSRVCRSVSGQPVRGPGQRTGQRVQGLGYLTGINLFLSAFRFDKPVVEVWRAVLPFLLILAMVVLLVTYVRVIIGV